MEGHNTSVPRERNDLEFQSAVTLLGRQSHAVAERVDMRADRAFCAPKAISLGFAYAWNLGWDTVRCRLTNIKQELDYSRLQYAERRTLAKYTTSPTTPIFDHCL